MADVTWTVTGTWSSGVTVADESGTQYDITTVSPTGLLGTLALASGTASTFDSLDPDFSNVPGGVADRGILVGYDTNNGIRLSSIEQFYGTSFADIVDLSTDMFAPYSSDETGNTRLGVTYHTFIQGAGGDDVLIGSQQADQIFGGDDDDILRGGSGEDDLYGGAGNDTLYGGLASDFLTTDGGNDDVFGGAGDDYIWPVGGGASVQEIDGTKLLDGGLGFDTMQFEDGSFDNVTLVSVERLFLQQTATNVASFEAGKLDDFDVITNQIVVNGNVVGSGGAISLEQTTAGSSTLNIASGVFGSFTGSSGADIVDLSAIDVTWAIDMGDGNDTLIMGEVTEFGVPMSGGAGTSDTLSFETWSSGVYASISDGWDQDGMGNFEIFSNFENLVGTDFDDTLLGDVNDNDLTGGLGSDSLTGIAGSNTFIWTSVNESPDGAANRDTVTDFDDTTDTLDLSATNLNQYIGAAAFTGSTGEVRLDVQGANSVLQADANGDGSADFEVELLGFNTPADLVAGGNLQLATTLVLSAAINQTINGDNTDNDLIGGAGNDTIIGRQGDDTLTGRSGDDRLLGATGDDRLEGDAGSDLLWGSYGKDLLAGGDGADRFSFTDVLDSTLEDQDWVLDFDIGEDRVLMRQLGVSAYVGDSAFSNTAGELRFEAMGIDGQLQFDEDGDGVADLAINFLNVGDAADLVVDGNLFF